MVARAPRHPERVTALAAALMRPRALLLAGLWLLAGCSREQAPEHYATRGLVRAREGSGAELRLAIHHEALATFRDREGQRAPMSSMTMLFGLAKELERAAPEAGTKLAFEFEVRWDERPTLQITRLRELPSETELALTSDHH